MKLQTLKLRIQTLKSSTKPLQAVERKRGSAGVRDRSRIKDRDNGLCVLCLKEGEVGIGAVVDHIIPLWAGGSDADDNKQALCHPHHDAKTEREAKQRASGG